MSCDEFGRVCFRTFDMCCIPVWLLYMYAALLGQGLLFLAGLHPQHCIRNLNQGGRVPLFSQNKRRKNLRNTYSRPLFSQNFLGVSPLFSQLSVFLCYAVGVAHVQRKIGKYNIPYAEKLIVMKSLRICRKYLVYNCDGYSLALIKIR